MQRHLYWPLTDGFPRLVLLEPLVLHHLVRAKPRSDHELFLAREPEARRRGVGQDEEDDETPCEACKADDEELEPP